MLCFRSLQPLKIAKQLKIKRHTATELHFTHMPLKRVKEMHDAPSVKRAHILSKLLQPTDKKKTSRPASPEEELKRFFADLIDFALEPLAWWKEHAVKFSLLAALAKKLLGMWVPWCQLSKSSLYQA